MIAQTYCDCCGNEDAVLRLSPLSSRLLCYECWDIEPKPPEMIFRDSTYTLIVESPYKDKFEHKQERE